MVFLMKIIKNSPHRIASRPSSVEKAKPLTKRLKVTDSKRSWLFCGGYGYVIWKNDKKGINIFEGSLEVKLPTIWTHEKQRWDESEKRRAEKRREEKRREEKRRERGEERGQKVGLLKRRVRSHVVRWEMTSCTPLWREAHFQVKMYKTPQLRSTFRSCDVEKVHAVAARSTFASEKLKHSTFRTLLEVEMSKKCTPLWR